MAKFNYTKRVLVKGWKEIPFTIEADNEFEADKMAKKELQSLVGDDVLFDEEVMHPENNDGKPTKFIFADNGEEIDSNEWL